MATQPEPGQHQALVRDDGQWYDIGTRVHLERTSSGPAGYCLVPDVDSDREVLGCRRVEVMSWPMLVVSLQRIRT